MSAWKCIYAAKAGGGHPKNRAQSCLWLRPFRRPQPTPARTSARTKTRTATTPPENKKATVLFCLSQRLYSRSGGGNYNAPRFGLVCAEHRQTNRNCHLSFLSNSLVAVTSFELLVYYTTCPSAPPAKSQLPTRHASYNAKRSKANQHEAALAGDELGWVGIFETNGRCELH